MAQTATSSTEADDYAFLADDFEAYAESALVIRTKQGGLVPFKLNSSQRFVHERLEQQRRETVHGDK